jgi:choline dehydrogenase-like flavoprotein
LFAGGLALCRQLPTLKKVNCATLLMVYVTPFSKGSVKLTKQKTPCIDFALLQDERDLECLEKGLSASMEIANDQEYKDNCIKRWIMHPDIDGGVTQYIKDNVDTLHHYAGTCKVIMIVLYK